ncbi:hypothetical protein [Salipiger abyssi]|uniref:hypothetical protein n=1 Tax=Salipiger abyssi TaxID=1250539 RepID=UPI001A8E5D3C|nr:hypothetical protein [Salipiger abyssi]MBN9886463.1 hypothetical protein [Salipiger abyssi]
MPRHISRKLLLTVLVLALLGAGFFMMKAVRRALYWADPQHHEQAPEGWMTLGYVERSHRMAPRSLGPLLGIAPGSGAGHRSLAEIAEMRGQSLDSFLAAIDAALERAQ